MKTGAKIILTCGHPTSGFLAAHEALLSAGVVQEYPSPSASGPIESLYNDIFRGSDIDEALLLPIKQMSSADALGGIWKELVEWAPSETLGWADPRTTWILDLWKERDPQICFVFIYSAPEVAVSQMLLDKSVATARVDQAVSSWLNYNAELLRFYHRHSNRCLLINATTLIREPVQFIEKVCVAFGLTFTPCTSDLKFDTVAPPEIAKSLARELIAHRGDAVSLFQELESSADIDASLKGSPASEKDRAWQEYEEMRVCLDRSHRETVDLSAQAADSRMESEALRRKVEDLQEAIAWTRFSRLREAHVEIESLREKLEEQERISTKHQKQADHALTLSRENELLKIQLLKLQEELDHYTAPSLSTANAPRDTENDTPVDSSPQSRSSDRKEPADGPSVKVTESKHVIFKAELTSPRNSLLARCLSPFRFLDWIRGPQEAVLVVDMRKEIDGRNWYYPEHDGRWAGPGNVSCINIPSIPDGRYALSLTVVGAMNQEILSNMKVSLNGIPLDLKQGICARISRKSYPKVISAKFSTQAFAHKPLWELQFNFPAVVSPSETGWDPEDQRRLAIRLQSIVLRQLA